MFLRLVAAVQREENLESYFEYELATEPTSLFKNGMLRKAVKSELKNIIIKDTYPIQNIPKDTNFVIDGGALLYQTKWKKNQTFKEIIERCYHCLKYKYPSCTVIFDWYSTKPSIKDHEHARRFDQNSPYVTESLNVNAPNNQCIFLSNSKNKSQFIEQLKNRFLGTDIKVMQSENDADTMIVNAAINMAKQGRECSRS